VLSALLFDLGHLYQGLLAPGCGFIVAIYYLSFGRVWPTVPAHYLHDALQFVFIVVVAME
jgi:hypothetical protein